MLQFTETFLNITITDGLKNYSKQTGGVHQIKIYRINKVSSINAISTPGYSGNAPTSQMIGKNPETVRIDGRYTVPEITAELGRVAAFRRVNTPENIFLPGSILTTSGTWYAPEIGSNTEWVVNNFTIEQNNQQRNLILFTLELYRWYED